LALLVLGFGVKLGLVPFHSWMPLTYRAAPIPAAAVLSGAGVKAGVIGLVQFLPFHAAWPEWGEALVILGMVSAFYGVVAGITHADPRSVLGYSSISQMGVLAAILGMGLAGGNDGIALPVACYAVNHTLVKGGLFVAIGAAQAGSGRRLWGVLVPATVIALGLRGLPLTGGWLAKLAVKPVLGGGIISLLANLSSAGTTLLMIHFVTRLRTVQVVGQTTTLGAASRWAWLGLALASIAIPWIMVVRLMPGVLDDVGSLASLVEASWPVLLGGAVAVGLLPLRHWLMGRAGTDAIVLSIADRTARRASAIGEATEKLDLQLRRWPVAVTLLLNLTALLAALLLMAS
jgi:formate hydrogenlyase subunit 3/multisubunit Na+/H+ antiporter MnhD subunit